jgi:hypothetical protein
MLRAAAASPNSGLGQQLDFHELGWLRTPLRRRCCASVGGEERKPPILTRLPSPVTGRGADEFWSEGIASDAITVASPTGIEPARMAGFLGHRIGADAARRASKLSSFRPQAGHNSFRSGPTLNKG